MGELYLNSKVKLQININFDFSLVMVNLFVAIIVSDIDKLKRDGRIEETRQKIYHIINAENILSCFHYCADEVHKSNGNVCTHSICFDCKAIKINPVTREKLEMIIRLWKNDATNNGKRRQNGAQIDDCD